MPQPAPAGAVPPQGPRQNPPCRCVPPTIVSRPLKASSKPECESAVHASSSPTNSRWCDFQYDTSKQSSELLPLQKLQGSSGTEVCSLAPHVPRRGFALLHAPLVHACASPHKGEWQDDQWPCSRPVRQQPLCRDCTLAPGSRQDAGEALGAQRLCVRLLCSFQRG